MTPSDSLNAILRYLKKQHVLTLACHDGQQIWCANCYYVFDVQRMAFWIMSDTQTRHGQILLKQPQVAGTVSGQPRSVALIKGIQFSGTATRLTDDNIARAAYLRRFPIAERQSTPLWEIAVTELKMTDNSLGFGTKLNWRSS